MDIQKGKQYTVSAKFTVKGAPAVFIQPPKWTLYNADDEEIISGAAVHSGNVWEATFTVSNNYVVPNGKEQMVLQFEGYDKNNRSFTRDFDITIIDASEDYKADGLIYNVLSPGIIKDSILLPAQIDRFTVKIFNPIGAQVGDTLVFENLTTPSRNSNGYVYEFNIPVLNITNSVWLDPYQIMIEYEGPAGSDSELHPLYIMNMKMINTAMVLRQYLDKAKLIEIDPSLQWAPTELLQSVLEGAKFINGFPPDGTFWNMEAWPSTLDHFLMLASAFYALNMRYLAEGMQKFDFSGLNTQLTFDRTDAIQTKMAEIQGILEGQLPNAKKSAIAIIGKGTAPEGAINNRVRNLGVNGYSINLLNNYRRPGFYGYRRRMF